MVTTQVHIYSSQRVLTEEPPPSYLTQRSQRQEQLPESSQFPSHPYENWPVSEKPSIFKLTSELRAAMPLAVHFFFSSWQNSSPFPIYISLVAAERHL